MSVEDIANQSSVMTKKTHFRGHDSQGSTETLVRIGGTTNYHLIAHSFGNISAKNYQNLLMCIEVIVCNVSVFFETQCISLFSTETPKLLDRSSPKFYTIGL